MLTAPITLAIVLGTVLGFALWSPTAALASTARSSNWAGYATHRRGLRFKEVSAEWIQPNATCTPGLATFSSVWVGLGGYRQGSNALEQIGSEVDCSPSGRVVSSAWYELVPSPSHTIRIAVAPGDKLKASVTVIRHRVTVALRDLTRGTKFTRTVHDSDVDRSSADWIVEAPSDCQTPTLCRLLPLTDFGTATFTSARAVSVAGHAGGIADRHWQRTKITLSDTGRQFVGTSAGAGGRAAPSPLSADGGSFTVTYVSVQAPVSASAAQAQAPTAASLLRPGLSLF